METLKTKKTALKKKSAKRNTATHTSTDKISPNKKFDIDYQSTPSGSAEDYSETENNWARAKFQD